MAFSAEAARPMAQSKGVMNKLKSLLAGKAPGEATGRGKDKIAKKEARKGANTSSKDARAQRSTFLALFSCFGLCSGPCTDIPSDGAPPHEAAHTSGDPCETKAEEMPHTQPASRTTSFGPSPTNQQSASSMGGASSSPSSSSCADKPPLSTLLADHRGVMEARDEALLTLSGCDQAFEELSGRVRNMEQQKAHALEVQREALEAVSKAHVAHLNAFYTQVVRDMTREMKETRAKLEAACAQLAHIQQQPLMVVQGA